MLSAHGEMSLKNSIKPTGESQVGWSFSWWPLHLGCVHSWLWPHDKAKWELPRYCKENGKWKDGKVNPIFLQNLVTGIISPCQWNHFLKFRCCHCHWCSCIFLFVLYNMHYLSKLITDSLVNSLYGVNCLSCEEVALPLQVYCQQIIGRDGNMWVALSCSICR